MSQVAVTLGGSAIDPMLLDHLIDVRVETTTGLPDVCTLRFSEGSDAENLQIVDNEKLALAAPLVIKLAKVDSSTLVEVFAGEITTIEAELGSAPLGTPRIELTVVAHDKSHRMHRKTTTRTFRQVTAADVARKMAGEHGLKVGKIATMPGGVAEELHQIAETDWSFLSRHLRTHGGELEIAAGTLNVVDPSKTVAAVGELKYGENLVRFRPRISSLGQSAKVTALGWDPKTKKVIAKQATPKASTTTGNAKVDGAVSGSAVLAPPGPVSTDAETQAYANGVAQRMGAERVQGEGVAMGDPVLVAGEYVKITGVGTRFGGTHRIVSATHDFGQRGYEVRLTLGGGGRPLAESVGAGGRAAGMAQTPMIGIVKDNKDPDKLGRVKVSYPMLNDEVESGWLRVVREASGKERGTVALPEINDEVLVVFEHGDPRRGYVLGALFNGKDTPGADLLKTTSSVAARYPRDLDVATKEKGLLTTGKDLTVKAEQGPMSLTAGKEITIEASAGGPPSAINIKTTGQIKADGKQGVEITASGPLKISSTAPVTVESKAALQLKGSIVQVEATGVLMLKGATVMIG